MRACVVPQAETIRPAKRWINMRDVGIDPIRAPSPALQTGTRLRVYFQRPDESLVSGGTVTN